MPGNFCENFSRLCRKAKLMPDGHQKVVRMKTATKIFIGGAAVVSLTAVRRFIKAWKHSRLSDVEVSQAGKLSRPIIPAKRFSNAILLAEAPAPFGMTMEQVRELGERAIKSNGLM
jgi:hypothetical protein